MLHKLTITSAACLLLLLVLVSCEKPAPNVTADGTDVLQQHQTTDLDIDMQLRDTVYVPIYSEIYDATLTKTILLAATLSIRNTSPYDTMYIETLDYYNSKGNLVRSYVDRPIVLNPLETIDYVIDKDDVTGGTGANFLVHWGATMTSITQPIFQGVMISTAGQHGISFTTDGVSISRK